MASNVTVVSVAGGERDIQVPAYLTRAAHSMDVAVSDQQPRSPPDK